MYVHLLVENINHVQLSDGLLCCLFCLNRSWTILWFQKNVMAGKKIVWVENGLNIGNRASGLGLNIKDMDVLLSALKNLEIIQF